MAAACHMTTPPHPHFFFLKDQDWSSDAENSALPSHKYFFIYSNRSVILSICIYFYKNLYFSQHFVVSPSLHCCEIIYCIFSAICLCSFFLRPQAVWLWTIFRSKGGSVHVQSHSELRLRVCLPLVGWSVSQRKGSGEYCVLMYQYCPVCKADDVHALQIISNEMRANIISIQISTADSDAHLIIQSSELSRSLFIPH